MADFTPSYAANIGVRAFLTYITKKQLNEVFNHRSVDRCADRNGVKVYGKLEWETIKTRFHMRCAYCGQPKELTVDHLAMFNRSQGGLQHPRNVVPSCRPCNNNRRKTNGEAKSDKYDTWEAQLKLSTDGDPEKFKKRKKDITDHILKYAPNSDVRDVNELLAVSEDSIRIAERLYNEITDAIEAAQCKYV